MGKRYTEISGQHQQFIRQQKIFFVATATTEGRVNISPKGLPSLHIMNTNRVIWLNVTGSGNETATHVQENPRMTLMFMAFEGAPLILRLYGHAECIHKGEPAWDSLYSFFPDTPGARQIFAVDIDLVQTSCGLAVPLFDYQQDREQLNHWAEKKGEDGIKTYWHEKNQISLDGKSTRIVEKNR